MRSALQTSAFLLVIGASIGVITSPKHSATTTDVSVGVGHHETQVSEPPYEAIIDDFDHEETTGSIWLVDSPRLALDEEQRGFVFLGVVNLPDVTETAIKAPQLTGSVPKTVELHDIPAMVIRKIPQLRDYKFVKLDDRILLVAVGSREVAVAIPRYKLVINP